MSLLERVELSIRRIDSLKSLKQLATQAADFEHRATTLAALANELDELRAPAKVLKKVGIDLAVDGKLLSALRSRANLLRNGYTQDRNFILSPFPGEDFRFVFVNSCTTFKKKTEVSLRDAWSGWVKKNTPAIDQDVLSVLSTISVLSATVANIQAEIGVINRAANVLPRDEGDAKQVAAFSSQVNNAWHQLAGEGVAPDVLAFLRAAGSSLGATYELLTPSILEWLDKHNLRHVLRVRLG